MGVRLHLSQLVPFSQEDTMQPLEVKCARCETVIPAQRLEAAPNARLCVVCQDEVERGMMRLDREAGWVEEPEVTPIEIRDDRLVTGAWSAGFLELTTQSSQIRDLLRAGKKADAAALVRALTVEAQAALVVLDENPEEVLSMTGMDENDNPGYSTAVVARLPTEMLAGLIDYDPERRGFNTHLIRTLTPGAFRRAVAETLDPIDNAEIRSKVSFEWLRALADLRDVNKRAELLHSVDPDLLEEALIPHVKNMGMNDIVASLPRHRFFSDDAAMGERPSAVVEDPVAGRVLDALYEADADLMRYIIRGAWERMN